MERRYFMWIFAEITRCPSGSKQRESIRFGRKHMVGHQQVRSWAVRICGPLRPAEIGSVAWCRAGVWRVYNLTIASTHSYFVGSAIWVHNANKCLIGQTAAAGQSDVLHRAGGSPESADALADEALKAQKAGFPHGISVHLDPARLPANRGPGTGSATREALESAGFPIHQTPTPPIRVKGGVLTGYGSPQHHTLELPTPVAAEVAERLNSVVGRPTQ